MKRMFPILGGVVAVAVLIAARLAWGPSHTPPGQPPLVAIRASNFSQLQNAFNSDTDKIRVVLLLSPT